MRQKINENETNNSLVKKRNLTPHEQSSVTRFKQKNTKKPSDIFKTTSGNSEALDLVVEEDFNNQELAYIEIHRDAGYMMMNTGECNIGGTITEETRQRLSDSHKGQPAYWKGKKMPDWLKEKLRIAQTGKRHTLEHTAIRALSNTGKKRTEETKRKMSIALKGKAGYAKGTVVCSEERKEKIRAALTGHSVSEETREKIRQSLIGKPSANKGRKYPPEQLEKMLAERRLKYPLKEKVKPDPKPRKKRVGSPLSEETKRKIGAASRGKTASEETRKKQSEARHKYNYFKKYGHNGINKDA